VIHDFEPFGVEIAPNEPDGNTHDFTGQERDPETGNDYMHFRSFESAMGRFMSPDNVFGNPMDPQSFNLCAYGHGNPVNYNDPTGHLGAIEHGGTQINPDVGVGEPSNPWKQRFKTVDPLNVTVRPSSESSHQPQPESDMQRWGGWMAQHAPDVYRALAKMFPEVAAGAWAHTATDIPASTGFGTFDEMLAKDVLKTSLLNSLLGPAAGAFSIFSGGKYICDDLLHPNAEWSGTKEMLAGIISGAEALLGDEAWTAGLSSIPGVGEVVAAGAGGWAVGSGTRHMLPDSANQSIGNGLLDIGECFGYRP
jgi:RHS repeat-associated protein